MSLNLTTVQGFVTDLRSLLQDKVQPYRYSDDALLTGLNLAILEGLRIRPDLFICQYGFYVPSYETVNGDEVPIEPQFRLAFEYGAAAHVLLRDEEDVQDSRANSFNEAFHNLLVGTRITPIQGGTPAPDKAGGSRGGGQPQQG